MTIVYTDLALAYQHLAGVFVITNAQICLRSTLHNFLRTIQLAGVTDHNTSREQRTEIRPKTP